MTVEPQITAHAIFWIRAPISDVAMALGTKTLLLHRGNGHSDRPRRITFTQSLTNIFCSLIPPLQ